MKKSIFILILFSLLLGFIIGLFIYKNNNFDDNNLEIAENPNEVLIDDECTKWEELNSVSTNSSEDKISPKAKLTLKILYKKCNHVTQETEQINNSELINLSQEEFEKKYPDWEIQRFTPTEVVLYKEIDDFCNEHYKIKEKDGNIAVYKIDRNGKENLDSVTDISVSYLANEDIEKIEKGITVYSKKELNKKLEDFE